MGVKTHVVGSSGTVCLTCTSRWAWGRSSAADLVLVEPDEVE